MVLQPGPSKATGSWGEKTMAFLASVILHGLLLASLLTWSLGSDVPLGVDRRDDPTVIDVLARPVSSAPAAKREKPLTVAKPHAVAAPGPSKESASETPSVTSAREASFGLREGTAASGDLGRPEGVAAGAKERYLYELRVLIQGRLVYPAASRRLRESGKVLVQFTILRDGTIENVQVKGGSAFPRLDQAAVELVAGLGKYRPLPDGVTSDRLLVELPVDYILR